MAENRAIGRNNKLPWLPIKEDLQFFREITLNGIVVVGSKTSIDLPPLPKRKLLVLTRSKINDSFWDPIKDQTICYTNFETILEVDKIQKGQVIVAGGAKTYELFLPYITEFYVTYINDNNEYDADVFMCNFEHLFPNRRLVRELSGGHTIVKYFK